MSVKTAVFVILSCHFATFGAFADFVSAVIKPEIITVVGTIKTFYHIACTFYRKCESFFV